MPTQPTKTHHKKKIRDLWKRSTSETPFTFQTRIDNVHIQLWCIQNLRSKKSNQAKC